MPVTTSPTQAAGAWYTDRFAPAIFQTESYAGHTTLATGVTHADLQGNASHNTQGRKLDLEAGTTAMSIDLFIDPVDSFFADGTRIAGFWGTGVDGANAVSDYPIIELDKIDGALTFLGWDNGVWVNLGQPTGFGTATWQTLNISLNTGADQFTYSVGDVSATVDAHGTQAISNVILQTYNAGTGYVNHWDNLATFNGGAGVPEPAAWAMMLAGFGGLGAMLRRRRAQATAITA